MSFFSYVWRIFFFFFSTLCPVAPVLSLGTTGRSKTLSCLHPPMGYSYTWERSPLRFSTLHEATQLFLNWSLEALALSLMINIINSTGSDCKQNYLQWIASVHSFKHIYGLDSICFNYLIKYCAAPNQMPHGHLRALYQHCCIY